jgi:hypothetical protein
MWATSAFGATETFYMCNGGDGTLPETATCATAYDEADFNTAGNWNSAVATNDGKIGPNDDVLFMDDGGVFNTQLQPQSSGTSGNPITLKKNTGDTPVITSSSGHGLDIVSKDYITIDGLTFTECADASIDLYDTDNVIIQNITINDHKQGVCCKDGIELGHTDDGGTYNTNTTIKDSTFNSTDNYYDAGSDYTYATYFHIRAGAVNGAVIEDNFFYDAKIASIQIKGSSHDVVIRGNTISNRFHYAISITSDVYRILIEDNQLYDGGTLSDLWEAGAFKNTVDFCKEDHHLYLQGDDFIVRGNRSWDSESACFDIAGEDGSPDDYAEDNRIYHNTCFSDREQAIYQHSTSETRSGGNVFLNNIFYGTEQDDTDCCGNAIANDGGTHEYTCNPVYQGNTATHEQEVHVYIYDASYDHTADSNTYAYNIFTPGNTVFLQRNSDSASATVGVGGWQGILNAVFPGWETNNISADPLFTDSGSDNFTPVYNSPAVTQVLLLLL